MYSTSWISKENKKEYNKAYYKKHKKRLDEKSKQRDEELITCDLCEITMIKRNFNRHMKSKQHQDKQHLDKI